MPQAAPLNLGQLLFVILLLTIGFISVIKVCRDHLLRNRLIDAEKFCCGKSTESDESDYRSYCLDEDSHSDDLIYKVDIVYIKHQERLDFTEVLFTRHNLQIKSGDLYIWGYKDLQSLEDDPNDEHSTLFIHARDTYYRVTAEPIYLSDEDEDEGS